MLTVAEALARYLVQLYEEQNLYLLPFYNSVGGWSINR
jgi:hypothetical protein